MTGDHDKNHEIVDVDKLNSMRCSSQPPPSGPGQAPPAPSEHEVTWVKAEPEP